MKTGKCRIFFFIFFGEIKNLVYICAKNNEKIVVNTSFKNRIELANQTFLGKNTNFNIKNLEDSKFFLDREL